MSHVAAIAFRVAVFLVLWPAWAYADEQDAALRYRRVEVPQDRMEDFVKGLLPIPRREFESLVSPDVNSQDRPFESATYTAMLQGNQITQGTASLIVSDRRAFSAGELLPIGGNLSMTDARWKREKSTPQAVIGDRDGESVVLADPLSREFEFTWSQRGETRERIRYFDIQFPDAFVQELLLDVPANLNITAAGVLVKRLVAEVISEEPMETATWSIRWSGRSRVQFAASPKVESDATANIDSLYRITESDLLLQTSIEIVGPPNTDVLELTVDPMLTVTKVTAAGAETLFTPSGEAENTILIELPQPNDPSLEPTVNLKIEAIGKLPINELRSLPKLQPQCKWKKETIRCRIDDSIAVADLQLYRAECRFLKRMDSSGGEWLRFDLNSRFAEVQLQIERRRAEFATESITVHRLQANSILAETEVKFKPLEGELFELEIDIDTKQGWSVKADSIQATAESDEISASLLSNAPQVVDGKLILRLRNAATPDRPVIVRFQLQSNLLATKPSIAAPQLLPMRVLDSDEATSWIYIQDTPGVEITTTGSEHGQWQTVAPNDIATLPSWIQERVTNGIVLSEEDLFLRNNAGAALVRINRASVLSLPTVKSNTDIKFDEKVSYYSLELEIDPLGEEINSLNVTFSNPTPNANWRFVGRTEKPIVNRTEPKDNEPDSHQILFLPIAEPFRLQLEFGAEFTPESWQSIPLATVANASGGGGLIRLSVAGAVDLDIQRGNGLNAIPLTSKTIDEESMSLRSVFRYDDTASTPPSLKIKTLTRSTDALAWAWRTDLRSYYAEEGRPRHRADVFVQNEADTQFEFELPLGFLFEKVEVDGVTVEPARVRAKEGERQRRFEISMPATNRYACVTIKYVEADRTLRPIDRLVPPLPKMNLLSMQKTWQIWLPDDYRVYDPESVISQSWLRRLVGFLSTPRGLEIEASIIRSVKRKWSTEVDDPLGLIKQIEVLLGWERLFAADEEDETYLRWGPRLQEIAAKVNRSRDGLYIDREEIRRMGVFANSVMPKTGYSNPRQMGVSRLSQSGLVLIVDGQRALITSASEARRHTRPTDWLDDVGAEGVIDRFGSSRILLVDDWLNAEFEQLWQPSRDELEIGLQRAGWSPNRNNIDSTRKPVQVYHRDTIVALTCSIFCFGFALGWRLYQTHRRRCLTLCTMAMAAALLMPQPGATLAVAFFWAMFASGLLRYVMNSRRQRGMQEPIVRSLSPTKAALWIFVGVAFWFGTFDDVTAQDVIKVSETPDVGGISPINAVGRNIEKETEEFVYFPTDAEQKPIDTVYMTTDFYRALRQQQNTNSTPTALLLAKTKYAGSWPSVGSSLILNATYQVTTLTENAMFVVPKFGDEANVDFSSVRANRKPITVQNNAGTNVILLPSAGDYRISFEIAATIARDARVSQVSMPIPVCPDSVLELRTPRNSRSAESATALGQQNFDGQQSIFSAKLGPVSTLEVAVTDAIGSQSTALPNLPDVEQLYWVKVDGQNVDVFVQFDFEGEPFDLQVGFDPLLVPYDETTQAFRWDEENSTLNTEFSPAVTMRFSFQRDDARRIELPAIVPKNAKVRRKRLAVSSGSQTNVRIDSEEVESLPPESFLGAWEDAEEEPDVFVRATNDLPEIDVMEVPLVEDWSSDVSYFFDQIETRVEVKAKLEPQYETPQIIPFRRLRVPSNLKISQLTSTSSFGAPLRIRWRRHQDEVVIFFLDEVEASSEMPLEIHVFGTVPIRDLIALSVVEFVSDRSDNSFVRNAVHIYRAANVDIILEGSTAPFVPDAVNPDSPVRPGYLLHGVWTSETIGFQSAMDALTIRRTTVDRKIEGSLTTRLVYDNAWSASITADLISDNDVDAIYFDLPASLCSQKPVAYEGAEELRVDDVTGGSTIGRRIIAVWLPTKESSKRTIQLDASLDQDQTSLPDVRLVNIQLQEIDGQPQRFAELPVESRDENSSKIETTLFNWKLSGLVPVASPNQPKYERYRISESDGTALLDEKAAGMQAEVLLLNTSVNWRENKSYVAMSEFDVNPADQTNLFLQLPADAEMIQVLCDDRHTAFSPEWIDVPNSKKRTLYKFRLNSSPWPQRVRVIYRGKIRQSNNQGFVLQGPSIFFRNVTNQLQPVSVDKEVWSVAGPRIFGTPGTNRSTDRQIDLLESDGIRVDAFIELWSRAQASIRERSREEKTNCLRTWAGYLRDTLDRYDTIENENRQELEQLMANYSDAFSVNTAKEIAVAELWNESQWTDGQAIEFQSDPPTENEFPTLELTYVRGPQGSWPRYLLALGVLTFGVFFPRWNKSSRLLDRALSEPHLATAVLGIFWWLCLSPFWVGVFLIVLSLALWVWMRFRIYRLAVRR